MNYPLITYLAHFHGNRDYFYCHDILEEHWKTITPIDKESVYVGLIQLAVGLYHYRVGNRRGASKMLQNALRISKLHRETLNELGIDGQGLPMLIDTILDNIKTGAPYRNINIPIINTQLKKAAISYCQSHSMCWQNDEPTTDSIIYKHRLRDRSDVIAEREQQLTIRKLMRKQD